MAERKPSREFVPKQTTRPVKRTKGKQL